MVDSLLGTPLSPIMTLFKERRFLVSVRNIHDSFPPGNPPMLTFGKTFFFPFIINLNEVCKVRFILDVILHYCN